MRNRSIFIAEGEGPNHIIEWATELQRRTIPYLKIYTSGPQFNILADMRSNLEDYISTPALADAEENLKKMEQLLNTWERE